MTQHFNSNGKLLLTGEYAVLDGALALGLPTTYGQSMTVITHPEQTLSWQSFDHMNNVWFETEFSLPLEEEDHSSTIRTTLHSILKTAQNLNPDFLKDEHGYRVKTEMNFPRDWGLGSSSTLINNIAQWAKIDAHRLLWKTSKGSGYDIACAQHDTPILYQVNNQSQKITPINFSPDYLDQLFFIHLNKKQNSRDGINAYRKQNIPNSFIDDISALTQSIIDCKKLNDFKNLITEHEKNVGNVLKIMPIKRRLFSDYFGAIKSLGAWGGDFILATGNESTPNYFKSRGYKTIILYKDMIKG